MSVNLENSSVDKGLEKVCFHSNPKEGQCQRIFQLPYNCTNKVMLKILQARLQQYVNQYVLDVQAGFIKGRGTRDQIANIHWIKEKAREFQKNICFCFTDYIKAFHCVDHSKLWKILKRMGSTRPPYLSPEKPVCRSRSNSWNQTWNNWTIQNWERSMTRLYTAILHI